MISIKFFNEFLKTLFWLSFELFLTTLLIFKVISYSSNFLDTF